nr:hypothetical protein [Arcanobacterium phocae]
MTYFCLDILILRMLLTENILELINVLQGEFFLVNLLYAEQNIEKPSAHMGIFET